MLKTGVAIAVFGSLLSGNAYAACVPVKGKIVNNLHTPAAFHTMGVASVVFGTEKLKCALLGTPQVAPPGSSVAFVHTISCDDVTSDPNIPVPGPVHSKLQFNTVGTVNEQTGSFTETSTPIPGTGTGIFRGVTDQGLLSITGQIYPTGAIDMNFSGQACY